MNKNYLFFVVQPSPTLYDKMLCTRRTPTHTLKLEFKGSVQEAFVCIRTVPLHYTGY